MSISLALLLALKIKNQVGVLVVKKYLNRKGSGLILFDRGFNPYVVFFDFIMKSRPGKSKESGGMSLIATGYRECFANKNACEVIHTIVKNVVTGT